MKNVGTQAQQVLLNELNQMMINLTGEGLSKHYTDVLIEGGLDVIQSIIDEQRMFASQELSAEEKEINEQNRITELFIRDMDNFESERCDSIDYGY